MPNDEMKMPDGVDASLLRSLQQEWAFSVSLYALAFVAKQHTNPEHFISNFVKNWCKVHRQCYMKISESAEKNIPKTETAAGRMFFEKLLAPWLPDSEDLKLAAHKTLKQFEEVATEQSG